MSGHRSDARAQAMNPQPPSLRGMVVTTATEGPASVAYVNITFVVPGTDAASVDLAHAFHQVADMVEQGIVKERPVAHRREFIQPVGG